MMQDRWPPEPPRFDPPRHNKSVHSAWLVLGALLAVALTFALIWGALQTFPPAPG